VSSFANARGGDLIIGIAAEKGIPVALAPLAVDADAELLRLGNMARDGLEARIPNLQLHAVQIAAGGYVLVIRVPRSYRAPHRVIFKGLNRFHARSSAGKYEPNVEELRALFAFAPDLAERVRAFRFERIARITAADTPVIMRTIAAWSCTSSRFRISICGNRFRWVTYFVCPPILCRLALSIPTRPAPI